jgi:hypothetical protein
MPVGAYTFYGNNGFCLLEIEFFRAVFVPAVVSLYSQICVKGRKSFTRLPELVTKSFFFTEDVELIYNL